MYPFAKIPHNPKITPLQSKAEHTPIKNNSINLITVGMAAHWFDLPSFYKEVERVATHEAVLALFGYYQPTISVEIDKITEIFYNHILKSYWPHEYKFVKFCYQDLYFPFKSFNVPNFTINLCWSLDCYLNYLNSLSASVIFFHKEQFYPTDIIKNDLLPLWGEGKKKALFPMFLKAAHVS